MNARRSCFPNAKTRCVKSVFCTPKNSLRNYLHIYRYFLDHNKDASKSTVEYVTPELEIITYTFSPYFLWAGRNSVFKKKKKRKKVTESFFKLVGFFYWRIYLVNIIMDALKIYGISGKESTCQCRRHKRCRFDPWISKAPWSRKWHPTPVFLPEKCHRQRTLVGYSPWRRRVRHDWAAEHKDLF